MDINVNIRIVREDNKEFKINGTDWKILELEGFGDFENDITVVDKAVGDGGVISNSRIADKDRTITAKSVNHHLNEVLRREANSFFNPKMMYKIYVTYMGVTRWAEGKIYKYSIPTLNVHRSMTLSLVFLFPDPYLKSFEDFGKDIATVTPMIAFPYLCAVTENAPRGITGGIYNFARKVILENDGDVEAYCKAVFVARGRAENPSLVVGNKYVKVLDILEEGDVIEMDFAKAPPTVKKNGQNCIGKCDRTSNFDEMRIALGTSEIQYDADDGSNLLSVSIYYNKLYAVI